jgi:hypothetical protein
MGKIRRRLLYRPQKKTAHNAKCFLQNLLGDAGNASIKDRVRRVRNTEVCFKGFVVVKSENVAEA